MWKCPYATQSHAQLMKMKGNVLIKRLLWNTVWWIQWTYTMKLNRIHSHNENRNGPFLWTFKCEHAWVNWHTLSTHYILNMYLYIHIFPGLCPICLLYRNRSTTWSLTRAGVGGGESWLETKSPISFIAQPTSFLLPKIEFIYFFCQKKT